VIYLNDVLSLPSLFFCSYHTLPTFPFVLSSAFVSPLFTAVYFHTLTIYPGFVFELVALLFVLCALIILSVRRGFGRDMMGVVREYLPLPTGEQKEKSDKSYNKSYPLPYLSTQSLDDGLD
jgi:hypothetical protein